MAHPGYQVLSDILFRLGLIANVQHGRDGFEYISCCTVVSTIVLVFTCMCEVLLVHYIQKRLYTTDGGSERLKFVGNGYHVADRSWAVCYCVCNYHRN